MNYNLQIYEIACNKMVVSDYHSDITFEMLCHILKTWGKSNRNIVCDLTFFKANNG